jgi:hypothetical protein
MQKRRILVIIIIIIIIILSRSVTNSCSCMQWHAGENVGCGKDYTIFSKVDGIVIYSKKKDQSKVRSWNGMQQQQHWQ